MSIVDRVEKLIALSASPNENEARNSAAIACKLIREHKLKLISAETHRPGPFKASDTPPKPGDYRNDFKDTHQTMWEELQRAMRHAQERAQQEAIRKAAEAAKKRPGVYTYDHIHVSINGQRIPRQPPPDTKDWQWITLSFGGYCLECKSRIDAGIGVLHSTEENGFLCRRCASDVKNARP